jgi:hypothetical protein
MGVYSPWFLLPLHAAAFCAFAQSLPAPVFNHWRNQFPNGTHVICFIIAGPLTGILTCGVGIAIRRLSRGERVLQKPHKNSDPKQQAVVCQCGWRTRPGLEQLKYNPELEIFFAELRPETPNSGSFHLRFLFCPECGKRIAPLQPDELMIRNAEVSSVERERLTKLARGLRTYEQIFEKLGTPDCDVGSVRTTGFPKRQV